MDAIKTKRRRLEDMAVKAALTWFQYQYPVAYNFIVKIDNEGMTNRAHAVACGLHVGASDLLLALPLHGYSGLWIEAKRNGWTLTKSQIPHISKQWDFIDKMRSVGYAAQFCIGTDEIIFALKQYMTDGNINLLRKSDLITP